MAWIESHQSLLTHRKTGRLARALNVSKVTAIGHLHAFWWWCLDNTQDGTLTDCDAAEIADAACWEGDAPAFVAAMVHAGFIDQRESGLIVHAWDEYTGRLIDRRRADAERKRAARSNAGAVTAIPSARPQDIRRTSAGHPAPVTRDGVRTVPTVPNHTKPEREIAHAGAHAREGSVATANAAPVSLSLSLVASHPAEPEPATVPAPANEPETPESLIHAACVVALGHGPTTGNRRHKWRDGVADLARLQVTAEDIPKLVRQYHAKYGDAIPCEPWNLADHYSELGVSPHVTQLYASGQHHAQHPTAPAESPDDLARRVRASRVAAGLRVPPKPELDNLGTP